MVWLCMYIVLHLAIWNEHQSAIDRVHKLLRSVQDKLEEQIKMRNEQVSVVYCLIKMIHNFTKKNLVLYCLMFLFYFFRINNSWAPIWLSKNFSSKMPNSCQWYMASKHKLTVHQIIIRCDWCFHYHYCLVFFSYIYYFGKYCVILCSSFCPHL